MKFTAGEEIKTEVFVWRLRKQIAFEDDDERRVKYFSSFIFRPS